MGKLVPKLRFKEFSGEWEEKKLGDIGKVSMCKRILKNQTTENEEIPFYKIGTFAKTSDTYISRKIFEEYKKKYSYPKKGDILISASGTIGRTVVFDGKEAYFQDSNIVWIANDEQIVMNNFLKFCYEKIKWITDNNTIARLYNENLRNIKILIPSDKNKAEQQKIANTLSSLDNLIESQNKKVEALKKHKKGLMQQLFPADGQKVPNLRFDGFSGEWEEKSLEEIINRISSRQYQINSSDYLKEGIYPVVDQGKKNIVAFSNNNSKVIKNNRGLIVFGDHTRIIKYIDFDFVVGADGTQLINVKQEFDLKFFYYQLLNNEIPNTGYNRHFKFLKKINYKVPCEKDKQEQQKIANTLSSLDSLIESQNKKVEALKKHKKGLMQQMFISSED